MQNFNPYFYYFYFVWFWYIVIFAGGTVRATGAGTSCPDWPLCFANLYPTSEAELPVNWENFYMVLRLKT